ncbi:hypothetical protein SAMN05444279_13222 [Ruegeria intermedia]|uniref:Secreted protein n=1 Tax=Ruegeria intermedia TaxID=996115 RepID=A0A1M5B4V9_9RHOB|nr:hypothetical protein [Ruegeria intermedia]SHF37446.1 hypothetical protein SAMN05444279_13222 [Ruegeria intermedia]
MFRLISLLPLLLAAPVHASEDNPEIAIARPAEGVVNDHFDETPKTSGGVLVGLRFAPLGQDLFDPANVRITPPREEDSLVCVSGVSKDGLYWSRTPYRTDAPAASAQVLQLQPFAQARYESRLRTYGWGAMAIVAFESKDPDCFAFDNRFLPEIPPNSDSRRLIIYVNSNSQKLEATLETVDTSLQAECQEQDDTRVAFDYACSFRLPDRAGQADATLVLEFDDGMGGYANTFTILLPEPDES